MNASNSLPYAHLIEKKEEATHTDIPPLAPITEAKKSLPWIKTLAPVEVSGSPKNTVTSVEALVTRRINDSICLVEIELDKTEANLIKQMDKSVPLIKEMALEYKELAIDKLKNYLDRCHAKRAVQNDFKAYTQDYINEIKLLTTHFIEGQNERFKQRAQIIKNKIKSEAKSSEELKELCATHIKAIKPIIDKLQTTFLSIEVKDASTYHKVVDKWNDLSRENDEEKPAFDKIKNQLALQGVEEAQLWQEKLKWLDTLKKSLNPIDLRKYLQGDEQRKLKDDDGFFSMHYSVLLNDFELARQLKEVGIKIYQLNRENGYTTFQLVMQRPSTHKFLELFDINDKEILYDKDPLGRNSFESAAYYGNVSAMRFLLAKARKLEGDDFDLLKYGKAALKIASLQNQDNIVGYLLPELITAGIPAKDLQHLCGEAFGLHHTKIVVEFAKFGIQPGPLEWCTLSAHNKNKENFEGVVNSLDTVITHLNQLKQQINKLKDAKEEVRSRCFSDFIGTLFQVPKPTEPSVQENVSKPPAGSIANANSG